MPLEFTIWDCVELLTEEFSEASPYTLRRLRGSSTTCFWEMSAEMLAFSVFRRGAESETTTSWDIAPTDRTMS